MNNELFPLEAILGSFMPLRMHMRLEGQVADFSPENASAQNVATFVHEHMHFFQTLMTGYGHIAWDSHRQMTSYLVDEWLRLPVPANGKRRLPLAHAARVSSHHLAVALVAHRAVLDMIKLGQARYWLHEPNVTLAELGLRLVPQPWPANPTIVVGGRSHTLQSKEVLEGHAHFVESTMLETAAGVSKEEAWDRAALPLQYYVALDWFLEKCGEDCRSEFPFVCDLAMQTSWNPPVPATEEQWRASNPAWRFVRLTEARRQMSDLVLGDPSEWPKRYTRFASSLLAAAGFQSLDGILSERLDSFRRKPNLLRFEELMRDAMRFRGQYPWCGGNPVLDDELWRAMTTMFRAPVVEIEGRLGGFGVDGVKMDSEVVFELQYQAFAAQVFGEFSRAAERDHAIECAFSRYDIPQGCEFQRSDYCSGRYEPASGPPHPVEEAQDGTIRGCYVEMLLMTMGLKSADLELDHAARLPTDEELAEMERQA